MLRMLLSTITLVAIFCAVTSTNRADDKLIAKAKCPISGKECDKAVSVDYNGGKVYFCCPGCPDQFKNKTKDFAAKANHQLVVTGQAKEVKCPIAGRDLNPDTKITVQGVDVCFCCPNCQGKAEKAKGDAQLNLIFGDGPFKKGFEVKKK